MAARGELAPIDPDPQAARAQVAEARSSLATCRSIVSSDPRSALMLAWDGVAFTLLSAALALAGYRVTSREGHHRVAVAAVRELFNDRGLFLRISTLRRDRDRVMYEHDGVSAADVAAAMDDCEELLRMVDEAVTRAATPGPNSGS